MAEGRFGRVVEVVAGVQGEQGYRLRAEPLVVSDVPAPRIDFNVAYKTDGKPNKGEITLYNPPQELISDLLRGEDAFISLSAGHVNNVGFIFAGHPIKDGVDVDIVGSSDLRVRVLAMGNIRQYRTALSQISLSGQQNVRSLVSEIAVDGGWTVGRNDIPTDLQYPRGFAFAGNSAVALEKIASYAKMDILFAGDTVSFLDPTAGDESQELVPVFSNAADRMNLIGTVAKRVEGYQFKGVLEPGLLPGDQVVLEFFDYASNVNRRERIVLRDVTYNGSTHGKTFEISGVGRPVGG